MKRHSRHQEYVFKVRDVTQQYVEQVLQENEKLSLLVRALQDELEHRSDEVSEALEELDRERTAREQLKTQVSAIEYENRRISEHYVEIERQNNDLAHLYVASYRLHETLNRDEVIQVVQEIVANLIGSEEMAIFEMQNGELKLLASHGIDAGNLQTTSLDIKRDGRVHELIEEIVRSGNCYVASSPLEGQPSTEGTGLTACVPLKVEGEVTGGIAVFRLLSQKRGLEPLDLELLDLLATHAAVALYCSGRNDPPAAPSASTE